MHLAAFSWVKMGRNAKGKRGEFDLECDIHKKLAKNL